ncbi:hypothetical protein [Streptomyces sp. PU-14G]|uniref:hypothetical protein n=1 Tax=Streptomyces sp. PU-14G TaxID=2800808 RepID=UPI0034DFAB22
MTETTTPADLTSQYTERLAEDLEHNTTEQERLTAEIAAMEERLAALQRDHTILLNMQQALGVTVTAAPAAPQDTAAVPSPRKKPAREPAKRKRTRAAATATQSSSTGADTAKKSADTDGKKAAPKSAPKSAQKPNQKPNQKSAKKPAAKTAQPTLVELVRTHLEQQNEPRSAAEIAAALGKEHSDRTVKTTVVRTTLENLVARNAAQRSKQGSSVFYTTLTPSASTAAAPTEEQGGKAE